MKVQMEPLGVFREIGLVTLKDRKKLAKLPKMKFISKTAFQKTCEAFESENGHSRNSL